MNWTQLTTNVAAAGGAGYGILQFVPPEYQPIAAGVLTVAAIVAGLVQKRPQKKKGASHGATR